MNRECINRTQRLLTRVLTRRHCGSEAHNGVTGPARVPTALGIRRFPKDREGQIVYQFQIPLGRDQRRFDEKYVYKSGVRDCLREFPDIGVRIRQVSSAGLQ